MEWLGVGPFFCSFNAASAIAETCLQNEPLPFAMWVRACSDSVSARAIVIRSIDEVNDGDEVLGM